MLKKWYIYIAVLAFSTILFFPKRAEAATSFREYTTTNPQGSVIGVRATNWYNMNYDTVEQITTSNNGLENLYKWNLSQNIALYNMDKTKYYTGSLEITLTWSPDISGMTLDKTILSNSFVTEGVTFFVTRQYSSELRLQVNFDNYRAESTVLGLPSIDLNFYISRTSISSYMCNFNFNISCIANYYTVTDYPTQTGYAGMLEAVIGRAIDGNQSLYDIIQDLEAIKQQDYTYYLQLVSQLQNLNSSNTNIYNQLTNFMNEVDNDFNAVQTVLDLFPSYRLQVLQYWQELLQMNAAQSSEAADVESQYQDKEQQSASLAAGMAVDIPSYQASDFNILSHVDSAQQNNFFGLLGMIANNSFISTLLLIAVTGMVVGFILYGKKT